MSVLKYLLYGLLTLQPFILFAADVGQAELSAITQILSGNLGLFCGLVLTVWGVWKTFVAGETGMGMILLICGVAITIFPGVFNFARGIGMPFVDAIIK